MEISEVLNITDVSIESMYELYTKLLLIVNRNYQRKLVWSLNEKEKFIESLYSSFPVPLFLVAESEDQGKSKYEIIDGMQRLEAMVSFIEGEYTFNGKFFDLESTAQTKYLKDTGVLKQKNPILERESSTKIARYKIPLSITKLHNHGEVEEIFRRINSNGKHLSRQEIRQAGILNDFSRLVRAIAESKRGDESHYDTMPLNIMKRISLNNRGLNYGIQIPTIFWCKNGIITVENIRESRDEELIAHILISILTDNEFDYAARILDNVYFMPESQEYKLVVDQIKKYGGVEEVRRLFDIVFDEIKKIIKISGTSFANLLFPNQKNYVNRAFQIVFAAFYEILIKRNKEIVNYDKIVEELNGLGTRELTGKLSEVRDDRSVRNRAINALVGILEGYFVVREGNDPTAISGITKLETLLNRSGTEDNSYDFKIGFHPLHNDSYSKTIHREVVKTLTAMANKGKNEVGYIIIGVADKPTDATKYKEYYGIDSIRIGDFHVTGINGEVNKGYKSLEHYRRVFEGELTKLDIQPPYYKGQILENLEVVNYYDKTVMVLKITGADHPVRFEGDFYIRQNTSTVTSKDKLDDLHLYERFIIRK